MKLNIKCGTDVRNGYVNIDNDTTVSGKVRHGGIESVDWVCEDGDAEEILAVNALRFVQTDQTDSVLQNWCAKLNAGGKITIQDTDLHLICKAFSNDQIDQAELSASLFGLQHNMPFRSGIDLRSVVSKLSSLGLKVVNKRFDGMNFIVEAEKC